VEQLITVDVGQELRYNPQFSNERWVAVKLLPILTPIILRHIS